MSNEYLERVQLALALVALIILWLLFKGTDPATCLSYLPCT